MKTERVLHAVVWGDDGSLQMEYTTIPDDIRNRGLLMHSHTLTVAPAEEYKDELEALWDAAQRLLSDALDDLARTPAYEPPTVEDPYDEDDEDD